MLLTLNTNGDIDLKRGSVPYAGQNRAAFIFARFIDDILPIQINNIELEINIMRPNGEQTGWQPMIRNTGIYQWYYELLAFDTQLQGEASCIIRWHDRSTDPKYRMYHVSHEANFIIGKGGIAQPINIDDDNYNALMNIVPLLQESKFNLYNAQEPQYIPGAFSIDGEKLPNAFYRNYKNSIVDINLEEREREGMLLVYRNGNLQSEFFFIENIMYSRTLNLNDLQPTIPFTSIVGDIAGELIDYIYANVYTIQEANNTFVPKYGNTTIYDTKRFDQLPISDKYATSNEQMITKKFVDFTRYTKDEIDDMIDAVNQKISGIKVSVEFDTMQNFLDWLDGSFVQEDGKLPTDLQLLNNIIIREADSNNYQVVKVPATMFDSEHFKVLQNSSQSMAETSFDNTANNLISNNGQGALEEINDKADNAAHIVELENFTIQPSDWRTDVIEGRAVYTYQNAAYTSDAKQRLTFIPLDISTNEAIIDNGIEFIGAFHVYWTDNTTAPALTAFIVVREAPTVPLPFRAQVTNKSNINPNNIGLVANGVSYNNTQSGMLAITVQEAIDELAFNIRPINQAFPRLVQDVNNLQSRVSTAENNIANLERLNNDVLNGAFINIPFNTNIAGGSTITFDSPVIGRTLSFVVSVFLNSESSRQYSFSARITPNDSRIWIPLSIIPSSGGMAATDTLMIMIVVESPAVIRISHLDGETDLQYFVTSLFAQGGNQL